MRKRFAHGYLSGRLGGRQLMAALPGVVGIWGHTQHPAELARGHLGLALGDVLIDAHRVGWVILRLQQLAD